MTICPHCGRAFEADDDLTEIKAECREAGILIMTGDTVSLKHAAFLVRREPGTLWNWRQSDEGCPLNSQLINGRLVYQLADIKRWREENAES